MERLAPNTSENFWLSTELLRDLGLNPATFEEDLAGDIPAAHILSNLTGEALCLDAYAATGIIDPGELLAAEVVDDLHR